MANFKNIFVDVDVMEPGKFYRLYVDSNGTTLLLPKDQEVDSSDVEFINTKIKDQEERISAIENKNVCGQPVTININSDCNSDTNNFNSGINRVIVKEEADVKMAELSANAVMIDYCLYSGKIIEAGKITILDTEPIVVDTDRAFSTQLLPITFSANKNNDVLNLHLSINNSNSYIFKYKKSIF